MPIRLVVLLLVLVVSAACGNGESDSERESEDARAGQACDSPPTSIATPSDLTSFPLPEGVVYTGDEERGPSRVLTGYADGNLDTVYNRYRTAFGRDPYHVTKSEQDAHDAEVNFAGAKSTGQVRLGEECRDRTSVQLTVRPDAD
jgi:hypothetical protein